MKTEGQGVDIMENTSNVHNRLPRPMIQSIFSGFQEKVQECVKSNFKRLKTNHDKSISSVMRGKKRGASAIIGLDKEKQLQSWKENPSWVDPPPNVKEVLSRKVLVDEGSRQVVELEQAAIWRFLWWSGTISVHVLVDQNREDYTMNFKQVKTGFMERFEGHWKVEPLLVDQHLCHPFRPKTLADYISYTKGKGRIGSTVSLDQLIQPAIVPPPPISWYLRGITSKTTEMIITDLVAEAARIRGSSGTDGHQGLQVNEESPAEPQVGDIRDIKERWALRRRTARHHRRLSSIVKSS
ncbi:uncharacterized protein LOC132625729 isoform X2 [Lycium barbarum]|uniref:uncharacterized protein LOC132625729 isoform X2 n=1 Tax=Lycium barbarum TaxID=112863 RepID=UPI00293EFCB7|nr:uncharacterized protein LOC132625729 isoform X2 [Lycium barbarum]